MNAIRREADVGIITALPIECTAVLGMLDDYQTLPASAEDPNRYYIGTLTTITAPPVVYRIVVALCSKMGNNGAAMAGKDLIRTFRVRHVILVGIAAGIPSPSTPEKHVRLGDVVVSTAAGVVQYDLSKRRPDGTLEVRSALPPPSAVLTAAARDLEVRRMLKHERPWELHLDRLSGFARRPPEDTDKLFMPVGRKHIRWKQTSHPVDQDRVPNQPRIHFGLIGSGNVLMKDVKERDRLAAQLGIFAIEMEGAGVADASWNQTEAAQYLIIRGICDYADRFKSDAWQRYAAVAAAAYLKALLEIQPVPPGTTVDDQGAGRPRVDELNAAVESYLHWVRASNRSITVRGVRRTDGTVVTFPVATTFISLDAIVRKRGLAIDRALQAPGSFGLTPIDFSSLSPSRTHGDVSVAGDVATIPIEKVLSLASTAVITGGPGSGKTTVLQYMAFLLADGLLSSDRTAVKTRLGIVGELPIPVSAPLNAFAKHLKDHADSNDPNERTLLRFVEHYVIARQGGVGLPKDFFSRLLTEGRSCALLLDGLDEIADEGDRIVVSRAVQDLAQNAFRCTIVVTSRTRAYTGDTVLPQEFEEFRLNSLSPGSVNAFLESFCNALYQDPDERAKNIRSLVQSVEALEVGRRFFKTTVAPLIGSPLMIRMVLTLHLNGRSIPDQRVELYQNYIDALILATYHPDVAVANRLSTAGGSLYVQRALLARIAFEAHTKGEHEGSYLTRDQLERVVSEQLALAGQPNDPLKDVAKIVEATRQRGGVLEESDGVYRFSHPALQEFLTGRYLAETLRAPERIAQFLNEDHRITRSWWHEPAVLCIGYVSSTSPDTALQLLQETLSAKESDSTVILARLEAVGEACVEWQIVGPLRQELTRRLAECLFSVGQSVSPNIQLRAAAGRILGRFGDPRPDVSVTIPTVDPIPGGKVPMGHPAQSERVNLPSLQLPMYEVDIERFAIGRYPVTNAQFAEFVNAGGYTEACRQHWTDAGWEWRSANTVESPAYWDDETWNLGNHPVVGVSWFEAFAYCRWLSATTGRHFSLPTEAEWEKAARGEDGRSWPWGSDFAPGRANTDESGIGQTTCVGLFVGWDGPYGIQDCAGNVWNWSNSQFRGFGPYSVDDGREEADGNSPRCIRGGSWLNGQDHARCANRDHYFPGDRHFDLGFRVKAAVV